MAQPVLAHVRFNVPKELQGDQQPANRRARERRVARDFRNRESIGMSVQEFDHTETPSQGKDKVGVAFMRRKLAAPARAEGRKSFGGGALFDDRFRGHGSLVRTDFVLFLREHTARVTQSRLNLFDGKNGEKLGSRQPAYRPGPPVTRYLPDRSGWRTSPGRRFYELEEFS